jgi:hypothetical protein
MKKRRPTEGMTLLEIAEASLHQVRLAPVDVLTPYYIGSLPFVLAFLYFWADMIQGAFGYRHVDTSALAVAAAYVWMKCWQTVYCAKMRANLAGADTGTWRAGRIVRIISTQTIIHATGIFVLPVALVILVPFGAVYAFYQNVTVFGADEENGVMEIAKRAWTEARRWPKQNHQVIWLFSPMPLTIAAGLMLVVIPLLQALRADWSAPYLYQMVTVYTVVMVWLSPIGILVAYNVGMMIYMVPSLLQSLLGIETAVSMGGNFFNSTFFAICVGVAALCLDPVLKAAYTLRCFHGESLSSGEDLRIALRRIIASKGARTGLMVAVALTAFAALSGPAHAQDGPSPTVVKAEELDRAISAELEKSEYVWRMPKEIPKDAFNENFLTRFLRSIQQSIADLWDAFWRFLAWLWDALFGGRGYGASGGAGSGSWVYLQKGLWLLVYGALLALLAIIVYRIYRQRKVAVVDAVATPISIAPNLQEDDVSADELPEDGWLNLARDLMERGDLRLAMRALFLASLSVLAHRELIRIGKSKSNREYSRELERLGHAVPEVPPIFAKSVRAFERVWYGTHEVDRFAFSEFNSNQERIRAIAKQH